MKISLCMIVKDEEEVLERCLKSAAPLVDEIVIVDTGSKDKTKEIAHTYTQNVFDFPWNDDFAAARNEAFSHGTGDYLLWLDADDAIPAESAALFPALTEMLERDSPDFVMCPYDMVQDGSDVPAATFYRERFLKREAHPRWVGRVHECIPPQGKEARFGFRIRHLGSNKQRGARNLRIYQRWAAEEPLGARDKLYYGRELFYHRLYTEAAAVLQDMLHGEGWYVNRIEACRTLALSLEALGKREEAFTVLFRSFRYGEPRAAVLCELGRLFREEKRWKDAALWYEAALACRDHSPEGDFESPACRSFVPLLGLVCCYYALGDTERARECHKKTEELAPEHPSVLFNKRFFPPSVKEQS